MEVNTSKLGFLRDDKKPMVDMYFMILENWGPQLYSSWLMAWWQSMQVLGGSTIKRCRRYSVRSNLLYVI